MKKNLMILAASFALTLGMSSCLAVSDVPGVFFMGNTKPLAVTGNKLGTKVGTAHTTNLFNLAVYGNGGIEKAAKQAGITQISHVDVKTTSVLTIFCKKTYYVYGD